MLIIKNEHACKIETEIIHKQIKMKNLKGEFDGFVQQNSFQLKKGGHHQDREIYESCSQHKEEKSRVCVCMTKLRFGLNSQTREREKYIPLGQ